MINYAVHAIDVANYFLATVDLEAGDSLSNLKVQKLLYYAQGLHIAMNGGEMMFPESLLAWKHGPVVKAVYMEFKGYHWHAIDPPANFDIGRYPPEVREILNAVSKVYGQFSATRLEEMTHQEPPWVETEPNTVIKVELLRKFFSKVVDAGKSDRSIDDEPVWPTKSFRFQRRRAISRKIARHRDRLRAVARRIGTGANPWAEDGS